MPRLFVMSPWKLLPFFVVTFCLPWWSWALLCLLYKPWTVVLQLATLVVSFKLVSGRVGVLTLGSSGCRNLLVMSQGRLLPLDSLTPSFWSDFSTPFLPIVAWSSSTQGLRHDQAPCLFLFPLGVHKGGCNTSRATQEANEVEAELLWVQLAEVDGRVVGKSFNFCLF